ncbi:MAG TPA: iron ABC transporter permease [Bacillota bacterium]|nr:iron ABC transporter permease [Bacillota bacterium]HOH10438.1 iron ABC transporter permease [Bacillota bacterium]HOY88790.1 iron ABC transporter permease [Bacillota bacterium]HPI01054.1 iron ABC transporter permease [Bacillota bacterium]HPM63151.1 iron ABC transporter permease [Bacillota bacterium]
MVQTQVKERKGFLNQARNVLSDPSLLIMLAIAFAFVGLFIIYPLAKLMANTTLETWRNFFTKMAYRRAYARTVYSSLLSAFTATALAFLYAYSIEYTEIKFKKFFRFIAFLPMLAPSSMTGMALIMLFGRNGLLTTKLIGVEVEIYGLPGIWLAQTIAFFPMAFVAISAVLRAISPNIEIAAQNLGAKGTELFRTVTLPLAAPGVLSAFLLVFINAMSDFANPKLLGGLFVTSPVQAYGVVTGDADFGMAATISAMLLIPSLAIFLIQAYIMSKKSYVTVTGKPVAGLKRITMGKGAEIVSQVYVFLVAALFFMVIGIVAFFAFADPKAYYLGKFVFTLKGFTETMTFNAYTFRNSAIIATAAGILASVVGLLLAFLNSRKDFPGKKILDFSAILPNTLPATFLSLAFLLSFQRMLTLGPIPILPKLTKTIFIMIIIQAVRQLPIGYRNALSGFKQIDKSIEEAATNLGANVGKTISSIVLPMLRPAFISSAVYNFISAMIAVSVIIFVVTPQWNVASIVVYSRADSGYYSEAGAMSIAIMAIILGTLWLVNFLSRGRIKVFD